MTTLLRLRLHVTGFEQGATADFGPIFERYATDLKSELEK